MRGFLFAAVLAACAGPAIAQSPLPSEMIAPESLERADADGDGVVTDGEFKAHAEKVIAAVTSENKRKWEVMLKVLDTPFVERLHVRRFHELNVRLIKRLDTDRDGKITRAEIESYAAEISLPADMMISLEQTAAGIVPDEAEVDGTELEKAFDQIPDEEAYVSSDGGAEAASDGRWQYQRIEEYMAEWRGLAKDGIYRLPGRLGRNSPAPGSQSSTSP